MSTDDEQNLVTDIRELALKQMADGLRKMGVQEDKIQSALVKAKRLNSDRPLMELAKPILRR